MIFGENFPINQPKGTIAPKPPIDIESFVNMFKAERDKNKNYERFELVKGRDIKFWYNQKNYSRFIQEDTTLAKSCLRYEESGKFLEMYVNNPDLVNMLILKDDVEKLRGRALVWYLTYPENRIYMERIYTINDSDVELYKRYAREQGWLYKTRQTYGYQHNIVDGKTNEELYWENFPMRVQLKRKPVNYFPYLDTLCVYNSETGVISNEGKLLRRPPYIRLSDHQGSFIDEADHREMVVSRHYNDEIPREEATFVNLDQDWVFQQDVVYVNNSGGMNSHRHSQLVCESNIMGNRKYFLKDSCVWSDYLKTFIYKDSVREGYMDSKKTNKVLIHRRMIGKYFESDKDGDLIKKKIDVSLPFEEYILTQGLTMKSKRSQLEKMYREWEYNRTINWNEPDGEGDTEEVTPRNTQNTINAHLLRGINNNPWDDTPHPTPRPMSTPRRTSGASLSDRISAITRNTNDPIAELRRDIVGEVNERLTLNNITEPNTPTRFRVTRSGLVVEERPIAEEPSIDGLSIEPDVERNIIIDTLGSIDPNTINDGGPQSEDTSDNGTPNVDWGSILGARNLYSPSDTPWFNVQYTASSRRWTLTGNDNDGNDTQ
jgi:hypothetical protein